MAKLHIFDMDNTLLEADCDVTWKEFLIAHGLAPASAMETADRFYEEYKAGTMDHQKFLEFQLQEFKGHTHPEMAKLAAAHFEEYIKSRVRPKAFDTVKSLIKTGKQVAMLTSTNAVLAYPVALHFGISDFAGTALEVCNGVYTGRPAGTYPGGFGKVFYLGRFCERYQISAEDTAAYGDSINDLRILEAVGTPIAVNPSPALREKAEAANWKIEDWKF